MTDQWMTSDSLEGRLLGCLKEEVAERGLAEEAPAVGAEAAPPWRRRAPRLAAGAAGVAALVMTALALSAGKDTSRAFAVEPQPEGEISVEIRSLEDARGLEEALDEAGIPSSVNYLPTGTACREPRFRSVPWPDDAQAIVTGPANRKGPFSFLISRGAVGPGQTLVITASPGPEVMLGVTQVEIAEGPVAPCQPVPYPAE